MVRIDHNTEDALRGRYARVALEIDLMKPLQSQVFVDDRWFHISYENIPDICFTCGLVGHSMASCPTASTGPPHAHPTVAPTVPAPVPPVSTPLTSQPRGEWMVAAPRQRRQPGAGATQQQRDPMTNKATGPSRGGNSSANSGSHFDVLTDYITVERPVDDVVDHAHPSIETNMEGTVDDSGVSIEVISGISSTQIAKNLGAVEGNQVWPATTQSASTSTSLPIPKFQDANITPDPIAKPTQMTLTKNPPQAHTMPKTKSITQTHTMPETEPKTVPFPQMTFDQPKRIETQTTTPMAFSQLKITDHKSMQSHATSSHGKLQRAKKLKNSMPYSRDSNQDTSLLSQASPTAPVSANFASTQYTFSRLLEKVAVDHGRVKPMDMSFDTLGMGHSDFIDKGLMRANAAVVTEQGAAAPLPTIPPLKDADKSSLTGSPILDS
ncbi:hypothetical protein Tsubulata_010730 [Turnera subulata]|uniref:CCHC-type domain-containing protein n=1 Tax=Turnera subulata TaxID=218843 RepID=A0A9Q0FPD4_9ROSI|nr:hypothetical protein Tsubulata_010730 [Turnera subulata]